MTNGDAKHEAVAALAPITRRRFLRYGLWGAAALIGTTGATFAWLRRSPKDHLPKPEHLGALSRSEYHLLVKARDTLLPTVPGQVDAATVPVLEALNELVSHVPGPARKDLASALALFDHGPLFSGYRSRFVDLAPAAATEYWDRWLSGMRLQRAIASAVRQLVSAAYLSIDATWPGVEYDGPVSRRWNLPSLGNAPLPGTRPGPVEPQPG